jgi:hypothetical protein
VNQFLDQGPRRLFVRPLQNVPLVQAFARRVAESDGCRAVAFRRRRALRAVKPASYGSASHLRHVFRRLAAPFRVHQIPRRNLPLLTLKFRRSVDNRSAPFDSVATYLPG